MMPVDCESLCWSCFGLDLSTEVVAVRQRSIAVHLEDRGASWGAGFRRSVQGSVRGGLPGCLGGHGHGQKRPRQHHPQRRGQALVLGLIGARLRPLDRSGRMGVGARSPLTLPCSPFFPGADALPELPDVCRCRRERQRSRRHRRTPAPVSDRRRWLRSRFSRIPFS